MQLTHLLPLLTLTTALSVRTTEKETCPCSDHVIALASGIHLNIQGQYGELNGTLALLKIAQTTPYDYLAFLKAQGELISDVQSGMNLRLFNQQIAPKDSPALPGLKKYQMAEVPEMQTAQNLTGVPAEDIPHLKTLAADIKQGILLNEMNLKNATQDCDFTLVFPNPKYKAGP